MQAFLNDKAVKTFYLDRVRQHREADELVQSYGYWQDGKVCAVGCTLHVDASPHRYYESLLGIPETLAHLEDAIFEGLPPADAQQWPERFLSAIRVGADLSLVHHEFCTWLLLESGLLTITDGNRDAIKAVGDLHVRAANGEKPAKSEWESARSAARAAALKIMSDKLIEILKAK